jgi:hypothetical protein
MILSPSSTGNLIFGLLISGISSCLTSLNFFKKKLKKEM